MVIVHLCHFSDVWEFLWVLVSCTKSFVEVLVLCISSLCRYLFGLFGLETKIQIDESVRGKDVFIVQTGNRDPNNMMMELFILAHSCKTSSASRIVAVVPYLPYSKQCRMRKRGSIPCKLLADMMVKAGVQHVITMDLHMKEIQGFFSCPVDNLRASSFLIQYLKDQVSTTHLANQPTVLELKSAVLCCVPSKRLLTTLSW